MALAACSSSDGGNGAGAGGAVAGGGVAGTTPVGGDGTPLAGAAGVPTAGSAGVPTAGAAGTAGVPTAGSAGAAGMGGPPAGGTGAAPAAGTGGMPAAGTGGMSTAGNTCSNTPPPAIKVTQIVDGLTGPTHAAQAPGDPSRIYVTEQQGTLRVIENGVLNPTPVIDLRSVPQGMVDATEITANSYGEGGLLAIVFHPDFETNHRLFLSYTIPGPAYSLAEFRMDTPGTIDPSTYKEILNFQQYSFLAPVLLGTNHVGSMVAFGPDGYLYVSRGDGGGENDRQMSGQDTSDDLCSILRIDPDTYPTPVAGNLEGHVWNYGFRNPWRFSFDRVTGDMYIGDVGQDMGTGFEEVNVEPAGTPGFNYGWRATDILPAPYQGPCSGDCGGTRAPAVAYPITATANSVIGGYVYRGTAIPGLVGRYVWADWSERAVKTFVYKGDENGQPAICDEYDTGLVVPEKVRSFAESLDGELYVVAAGTGSSVSAGVDMGGASVSTPGKLYRIDPM